MRRIVYLALAGLLLLSTVGAVSTASAAPNCQPGQHGNQDPGFKPAPCPPN
jgi:hypothetical protein